MCACVIVQSSLHDKASTAALPQPGVQSSLGLRAGLMLSGTDSVRNTPSPSRRFSAPNSWYQRRSTPTGCTLFWELVGDLGAESDRPGP